MKKVLSEFLIKTAVFSDNEINELLELLTVESVKKNTVLVKEGQICNACYFVLRGCLRQYVIADGIEKTTAFYTEEQAVNFFTSYTKQTASSSFLCSTEESILLIGNPTQEAELYIKFPKLAQLTQKMVQQDFGKTQDDFTKFITSSPEERYLNMLNEQPELLQRVPQHQLASYLGITAGSLSRIRKRILKK